jgi:catecholate siderophore receptor
MQSQLRTIRNLAILRGGMDCGGTGRGGIVGYARRRGPVLGLAALMGAAALGGAQAAETEADAATVSGVVITGAGRPLDRDTGLPLLPGSVQDTPQAMSIVTQAQMKAQGVNSLEQALRNVPGITIAIGEGGTLNGDQFKIRGFDAKDFGAYVRDSFDDEEVQVLKGPSGALFGRGTTGGVINTISKRPLLKDQADLDIYAGDGRYFRALADINHQLGDTSAVRLNLMASSAGVVGRDLVQSNRWGASGSAGWGLGTDTSLTVSYLHQHNYGRPDYGIILVQPPGQITARPASEYDVGVERSTFTGFRGDLDRSDADILTVRFSHKVSDALTLTSDSRLGVYSRYFQYTTTDQCGAACTAALFDNNPATEAYAGIGGQGPYAAKAVGAQTIGAARMDFTVGGLRHQAVAGIDAAYQRNDRQVFAYTLPAGLTTRPAIPHPLVDPDANFPAGYSVFRPVPGVNLFCGTTSCATNVLGATVFANAAPTAALKTRGESTDLAVFVTDRMWFTDQLSLIANLRLDRYSAALDTLQMNGLEAPAGGLKVSSGLASPRASLVWEPARDQTWYLSWGGSQTPQGTSVVGAAAAVALSARDLAPEDSEIWEAGAKLNLRGVALTASVFRIDKDNALQIDPATGFLQAQSGERQAVTGIELGMSGRINPNWTVSGGYAWLDAEIRQSFANCVVPGATTGTPTGIVCPAGVTAPIPVANSVAVGRQVVFTPKHAASLFTTYDLGDLVQGLSLGADVTYQSKLWLAYAARSVSFADRGTLTPLRIAETPESLTFDAFVAWKFAGRYRVSLNLYNIADRLNYTQVFGTRAVPSAGRTAIVSFGATF